MAERLGDQFEARWRRAYEVRHLENQNRHKMAATGEGGAKADPTTIAATAAKPGSVQPAAVALNASAGPPSPAALGQAHSLPSTGSPAAKPLIRQREVEDDDADFEETAAVLPRGPAELGAATGTSEAGQAEQEVPEPECRVAWDSSHSSQQPAAASAPTSAGTGSGAQQLKEQGTECLRQGDLLGALRCYSEGLQAALAAGEKPEVLAVLHSNRSHVLHKLRRNNEAIEDANEAHRLFPAWPKPLYRLAQAQLALGLFAPAVGACLKGEGLSKKDSKGHTEFTPLLDRIAVAAAKAGSLVGYTGLQLEVRNAGEEAWLCRPAPHVPELDGLEDEDSLLPATTLPALPSSSGGSGAVGAVNGTAGAKAALSLAGGAGAGPAAGDALAGWDYKQTAAVRERRRTSFRSLKEAVATARDGDRILLRRGMHNGMGEAVNVDRRVLIEGEGQLGEAVFDQRANSPSLRITRGGVVVRNLDLDHSGFCEAMLVSGGPSVQPLMEGLRIKCSGDDAVNVCGEADPTFRGCVLSAKKCGLRAYGSTRGRFEGCAFEKCGEQGTKAMEGAAPTLAGCTLSECGEEGVVAMDSARVTLVDCALSKCKGPGVDCSDNARVTVQGGSVEGCVGGVWVWDSAAATLRGASVAGGPSHALLADGAGRLDVKESRIRGSVHATEAAWEGIADASNSLEDPDQPTDFPPEEGPFKWAPDKFTRKQ